MATRLRRGGAVDVLVEAARVGTGVGAPDAGGQVKCAALGDIGASFFIGAALAGVGAGDGVAAVGPGGEGESAGRGDREVIAAEGDRAVAELLEIGGGGKCGDTRGGGPSS